MLLSKYFSSHLEAKRNIPWAEREEALDLDVSSVSILHIFPFVPIAD